MSALAAESGFFANQLSLAYPCQDGLLGSEPLYIYLAMAFLQSLPTFETIPSGDDVLDIGQSWMEGTRQRVSQIVLLKSCDFASAQVMQQISCFFLNIFQGFYDQELVCTTVLKASRGNRVAGDGLHKAPQEIKCTTSRNWFLDGLPKDSE